MYAKKIQCRACGGPKVTRSRTAFVYCDYCGTFTDFDFQIACKTQGSAMPGPAYEMLLAQMTPRLDAARKHGDRIAYLDCQVRLYGAHVEACPASYSPRVGDPAYREAIVSFYAGTCTISGFDPGMRQHQDRVDAAVSALAWEGPMNALKARPSTFWRMCDAVLAQTEASLALLVRDGILDRHPDGVTPTLQAQISHSMFVQGWLPYLREADAERLLDRTGLRGEYGECPEPRTFARFCSSCGADLPIAPGARRVLCETCGLYTAAFPCPHCGGPFPPQETGTVLTCPYCTGEVRIMSQG